MHCRITATRAGACRITATSVIERAISAARSATDHGGGKRRRAYRERGRGLSGAKTGRRAQTVGCRFRQFRIRQSDGPAAGAASGEGQTEKVIAEDEAVALR